MKKNFPTLASQAEIDAERETRSYGRPVLAILILLMLTASISRISYVALLPEPACTSVTEKFWSRKIMISGSKGERTVMAKGQSGAPRWPEYRLFASESEMGRVENFGLTFVQGNRVWSETVPFDVWENAKSDCKDTFQG